MNYVCTSWYKLVRPGRMERDLVTAHENEFIASCCSHSQESEELDIGLLKEIVPFAGIKYRPAISYPSILPVVLWQALH